MLKAIHAQEDKEAALKKASDVVEKLRKTQANRAADAVEKSVGETLDLYGVPE